MHESKNNKGLIVIDCGKVHKYSVTGLCTYVADRIMSNYTDSSLKQEVYYPNASDVAEAITEYEQGMRNAFKESATTPSLPERLAEAHARVIAASKSQVTVVGESSLLNKALNLEGAVLIVDGVKAKSKVVVDDEGSDEELVAPMVAKKTKTPPTVDRETINAKRMATYRENLAKREARGLANKSSGVYKAMEPKVPTPTLVQDPLSPDDVIDGWGEGKVENTAWADTALATMKKKVGVVSGKSKKSSVAEVRNKALATMTPRASTPIAKPVKSGVSSSKATNSKEATTQSPPKAVRDKFGRFIKAT